MLNSIQTLRALAAWLVVGHHYMQLVHNFQLNDPVSVVLHRFGAIGVDLFFIISGFVIYVSASEKAITPFAFAIQRLARIAPAYWIFTTLVAATIFFFPGTVPLTLYESVFFFKSLLFIPAQNPSGIGMFPLLTVGWTLNYEIAFYGVFLISLFFSKACRVLIIAVGIVLLCKLLPYLGGSLVFYGNQIVFEFLFGIFIAHLYQKGIVQRINLFAAILMTVISIVTIFYIGQVTHSPLGSGVPCAVILVAALSQEKFFSKVNLISKLGDWSYSTYLCHVLIIGWMLKLQMTLLLSSITTLLVILVVTLIVSGVSYHCIERPISNLFKVLLKKSESSAAEQI